MGEQSVASEDRHNRQTTGRDRTGKTCKILCSSLSRGQTVLGSPSGNITSGMIILPKKHHSLSELFALEPAMLANRFREFWPSTEPAYLPAICAPAPSAFVVCSLPSCVTPTQFAQMEYIYRFAYEQAQAQAQVATPFTPRIPAF